MGALVEAGFRPKEFLNWTDTERQVAIAMLSSLNRKRGQAAKKNQPK